MKEQEVSNMQEQPNVSGSANCIRRVRMVVLPK